MAPLMPLTAGLGQLEQQLEPVRQVAKRHSHLRRAALSRAARLLPVQQATALERQALRAQPAAWPLPSEVSLALRPKLRPMSLATQATRESAEPRAMWLWLDQRPLLCWAV